MTNDLFDDWHAIGINGDFPIATVKSLRLLARDLVAWRSSDGQLRVWDDRCPHRGAKLSQGQIQGNTLICPYHGLAYETTGQCVHIPAHPDCGNSPKGSKFRSPTLDHPPIAPKFP